MKHNTMVLQGLIEAVQSGNPAQTKARLLLRNLFGEGRASPAGTSERRREGTVVQRFERYVAELQRVAATYGRRLDLKSDQSALRAISRGFGLLRQAAPALEKIDRVSDRRRRGLTRTLRESAYLLHERGFNEIDEVLTEFSSLHVDGMLVRHVFGQVVREPNFSASAICPLAVAFDEDVFPVCVSVPRRAFDDVLSNLIRNAVQASSEAGMRPISVGLSARLDVDAITGLSHLIIGVRDCAPQPLSRDVLREGDIKRGLGLANDLVTRHGGSLDVAEGPAPWVKTISLRLPVSDTDEAGETEDALGGPDGS